MGRIRYISERAITRKGKRDGSGLKWRLGIPIRVKHPPDPPMNSEAPSAYQDYLVNIVHENLERIGQMWANADKKLQANCLHWGQRRNQLTDQLERTEKDHEEAEKDHDFARQSAEQVEAPSINRFLYSGLVTLITFAEIVFNGTIFNIFGESRVFTILMAIGLMIAIPVLSHFIGVKLKITKKTATDIGIMVVCALTLVAGLSSIAIAREKFFEANRVIETLGIDWSKESITWIFLSVNLVLIMAVVVLAYEYGVRDPHSYKNTQNRLHQARRVQAEESNEIEVLSRERTQVEEKLNQACAVRRQTFEEFHHLAQEEKDKGERNINLYRAANMDAREDKTRPISFLIAPDTLITLPENLLKLDCSECDWEESKA